jgi:membrane protein implicated in regulation of membrane protease activity
VTVREPFAVVVAPMGMCIERYVRLFAGSLVLLSLLLTHVVSAWFGLLAGFVGANLVQAALTGWCPLVSLLRARGVADCPKER